MALDLLGPDRLERAVADVQRDGRPLDCARIEPRDRRLAEMQAGRRRGNRAAAPRVNGLVAFPVRRVRRAFDVGRQRHLADRVDGGVDISAIGTPQADGSPAEGAPFEDLGLEHHAVPLEPHAATGAQLLPGMHQRVPAILVEAPEQQALHLAAARRAVPVQARRKHARVVHDHQVAGREQVWQIARVRACDRAARAVDDHQAGRRALGCRVLSDELGRQVEIEIRDAHARS